jgi:PAS domain S-box-containing protein
MEIEMAFETLRDFLFSYEYWLMERVLHYAKQQGYSAYTSTLTAPWRVSIHGLSEAMCQAHVDYQGRLPEFSPTESYTDDPCSRFGVTEARLHRERGISISMFMGLLKYYRQTYCDLIHEHMPGGDNASRTHRFVVHFFDRLELALCAEWIGLGQEKAILELQEKNRNMTNEKNKYLTLFESLALPVILLDQDMNLDNMNHSACKLLGLDTTRGASYYSGPGKPGDLSGTTCHVALDEHLAWMWPDVAQFVRHGEESLTVERTRNSGEKTRHYEVAMTRMQDISGKFTGIILAIKDITDRKRMYLQVSQAYSALEMQAEHQATELMETSAHLVQEMAEREQAQRALQESNLRYKTLVDNLNEGIWLVNPEGRLLFVNPRLARMLGHKVNDMVGHSIFDFISKDSAASETQSLDHLRRGSRDELELTLLRRDGSLFPAYAAVTPITDHTGQYSGSLAAVVDITERREMEEALRTAMRCAEQASRAKSEFLANMSHELRTPLNGVLGMLQLLRMTDLDREQTDYVDVALSSGRSLLTLLNDILDLSRVESGRLEIRQDNFNLPEVMREVVETFREGAQIKGLDLSCRAHTLDLVRGDPRRLRQILFNLVGNAVKFTHTGRVELEADILRDSDDEIIVLFSVSDTGVGMEPNIICYLFEPFTQADGSTTRQYQGTGLGLHIVQRLVELMNGTLVVDSEPDKGTTIYFTLRMRRTVSPSSEPGPRPQELLKIQRTPWRILVVEDNAINSKTAVRMLENLGFQAESVTDGIHVLPALQNTQYDCILMDVQMPVMDGLEATRTVRAHPRQKIRTVPIVAMTAHAMTGDRETCLDAGMNDYLAKPLDMHTLSQMLHSVLDTQ